MVDELRVDQTSYRDWRYSTRGDYHRNMDASHPYYFSYQIKMKLVKQWLASLPEDLKILDAGCGEGLLVEDLQEQGRSAIGLDLNYSSQFVRQGSVKKMPFDDNSFDVVLLLDVLEHLPWTEQTTVLREIQRVLKPEGFLGISLPNLAHLSSRLRFLLRGYFIRTDDEANHIGERPINEFIWLLKTEQFKQISRHGITLTVPFLYESLICKQPKQWGWLHDVVQPFATPQLAMYNFMVWQHQP